MNEEKKREKEKEKNEKNQKQINEGKIDCKINGNVHEIHKHAMYFGIFFLCK